jgi:hypothetical protein
VQCNAVNSTAAPQPTGRPGRYPGGRSRNFVDRGAKTKNQNQKPEARSVTPSFHYTPPVFHPHPHLTRVSRLYFSPYITHASYFPSAPSYPIPTHPIHPSSFLFSRIFHHPTSLLLNQRSLPLSLISSHLNSTQPNSILYSYSFTINKLLTLILINNTKTSAQLFIYSSVRLFASNDFHNYILYLHSRLFHNQVVFTHPQITWPLSTEEALGPSKRIMT